jgi:solute carrier family 20 (sodium-dependent phosphate transporter)
MATVYDLNEFLFLAVIAGILAFIYAFGIGANDVANAFASSVSSKSLTLKQAIIAAGIFEFSGSVFLGASVVSTIRSKIFNVKLYEDEPEIIMLGMLTSMIAANILLLLATYMELPVSTTHTIVGCIMGFSICAKGFDSIDWKIGRQIFMSWVISPVVSGFLSFCFFGTLRLFVLHHEDSYNRAYYTFPIVLLCAITINLFFILNKGMQNVVDLTDQLGLVLGVSFGTGALCGLVWIFWIGPIARQRVEAEMERRGGKTETMHSSTTATKQVPDGEEVFSDDFEEPDEQDVQHNVETKSKKRNPKSSCPRRALDACPRPLVMLRTTKTSRPCPFTRTRPLRIFGRLVNNTMPRPNRCSPTFKSLLRA